MIPVGVLLILYAVLSVIWPLFGKQLLLMTWIRFLPAAGQWGVRGLLVASGSYLIVRAVLHRRGTK